MPTPAPAKPAPTPATVASLLDKGDGVLTKRNAVWTYPACPNDRSGTNLVLPAEFVSDTAVQDALSKGDLAPRVTDAMGVVTSVGRPAADAAPVRIVNMMQAGSVEAATELPPNSRPTHDAGRSNRPVDVAQAQRVVDPAKVPVPVMGASTAAAPPAVAPAVAPAPAPAVAKP